MSSSFPSLRINQYLAKKNNAGLVILIGICYSLVIFLLVFGSTELHKANTFIICQCQVTSVGVHYVRHVFYPTWDITVIYENRKTNDIITGSSGTGIESWAWSAARKYKINQVYPCYHSQDRTSFKWGWQWNKPSKSEAYVSLFAGVALLVIATVLLILRRRYQVEFENTRQQQLVTPFRSAGQQETTALLENPPPAYDEVVQWPVRGERKT